MNLAEAARGHSTSYVVPIFHKRGSRGGGKEVFFLSKYVKNKRKKGQYNHT